jgi:hypothetical protein
LDATGTGRRLPARYGQNVWGLAIGRKAWLFSDTPAGAHASALIYSLVESAKANRVDPYAWLRCLMRELPAAQSVEAIEALLPWNLHPSKLTDSMAT